MIVPATLMPIPLPSAERISSTLFHFFEITAIVLGSLGGGLASRRDRQTEFDPIGILGLGLVAGVGGGIVRDVLLNAGPPLSLQHPSYLAYALLGAGISLVLGRAVGRRTLAVMSVVDALSLGFFTVTGAIRAMNAGFGFLPCLLMGVTTAVGGGSLRDIFSGHTPAVFREGEPYALVATLAALLFLLMQRAGVAVGDAAAVATVCGFAMRMAAIHFGWRTRRVRHLSDPEP